MGFSGELIALPLSASRSCLYSLAHGCIPASKSVTSGPSITHYCLSGSSVQFPLPLLYCIRILLSCNKLLQSYWLHTNVLSYSSGGQKSRLGLTGLKSRSVARLCSFWNMFFHLFSFLEVTSIPWLMAPSSIFKASSRASTNLSLTLLLPPFKDPCS